MRLGPAYGRPRGLLRGSDSLRQGETGRASHWAGPSRTVRRVVTVRVEAMPPPVEGVNRRGEAAAALVVGVDGRSGAGRGHHRARRLGGGRAPHSSESAAATVWNTSLRQWVRPAPPLAGPARVGFDESSPCASRRCRHWSRSLPAEARRRRRWSWASSGVAALVEGRCGSCRGRQPARRGGGGAGRRRQARRIRSRVSSCAATRRLRTGS